MSDFDRNASARWGQGVARAGRAEIDQGLRSYMLGVYNNMVVGLALTGLVALGVQHARGDHATRRRRPPIWAASR